MVRAIWTSGARENAIRLPELGRGVVRFLIVAAAYIVRPSEKSPFRRRPRQEPSLRYYAPSSVKSKRLRLAHRILYANDLGVNRPRKTSRRHGRIDCPLPAPSPFPSPTNEGGAVRESLLAVVPVQLSAGTSATVNLVPVASA